MVHFIKYEINTCFTLIIYEMTLRYIILMTYRFTPSNYYLSCWTINLYIAEMHLWSHGLLIKGNYDRQEHIFIDG